MSRTTPETFALLLWMLLTGCASGGYRYRFDPLPAEVGVHTSQGTSNLALVSVLGVVTPEGADREELHIRIRLQNDTLAPLRLPVEKLQLISGDLLDFSTPRLVGGVTEAGPGESAVADVGFGFPDGPAPDLSGLTLRWVLEVEGKQIGSNVAFRRVLPDPHRFDHPYPGWGYGPWGPHWPHGHGVSWHGSYGWH